MAQENEVLFEIPLSRATKVVATQIMRGTTNYYDVRKHMSMDGNEFGPTRKGIQLTKEQWVQLVTALKMKGIV